MPTNWTIRARILLGFSLVIGLAAFIGLFSVTRIASLKTDINEIATNWTPSVNQLSDIQQNMGIVRRQMVLTIAGALAANPGDIDSNNGKLIQAEKLVEQEITDYKTSVTPGEEEKLYAEMVSTKRAYLDALEEVANLARAGQGKEANEARKGRSGPLGDAFDKACEREVEFNKGNLAKTATRSNEMAGLATKLIVAGLVLAIVLAVAAALTIVRSVNLVLNRISSILRENAEQVASASEQLAGSSQSLAEGASEQAASIEETSASIEEISAMTKKNAEGAGAAQEASAQARTSAEGGVARTRELQAATESIRQASAEMGEAIAGIKKSSDDVAKIIKTIDEIAFQTNILALNAAVEAARAGEAGAGFAVVAEEVRALAQRSAEAAKETARLIEQAAAQSQSGVDVNAKVVERIGEIGQKSEAVGASLGEIVGRVKQVDGLVAEIAMASREQSTGLGQITTAVGQMDKVTQTNAAGAEEASSAAEELSQQAIEMQEAVGDLLRLVHGAAAGAGADSAPAKRAPAARIARDGAGETKRTRVSIPMPRRVEKPTGAFAGEA
ncbi:MAG TPA: methyl-accepting chemotaxis protein [Candidatus Methylacidiphilales bacterium]